MRLYDVSMPIVPGGLVYPGNPEIRITYQQAIAEGKGANVSELQLGSHTGTHVDAVKHFFDDGQPIDQIPLDRLIGPALLIEFPDAAMSVTADMLRAHELNGHTRILLKTRNSSFLSRNEFVKDYTFLAPDGAQYLVDQGVELVGIDYLSIEQFRSGHHQTHRTLLQAGVVIIEGLALIEPQPGTYDLICLPLRLMGIDGAPARAVLRG